eukprot:10252700-Karenia_brevis.AAC.1
MCIRDRKKCIVLHLHSCDDADFLRDGHEVEVKTMFKSSAHGVPVMDAAFVDDEAIAILAKTPHQLDKSVETMLKHL